MSSPNTPATRYFNTTTTQFEEQDGLGGAANVALYAWSTSLLQNVQLTVDGSGNLHVVGAGGGGADVQYVDGVTQATPTGTVALGKNSSNVLHALPLDASNNMQVSTKFPITANVPTSATVGVASGTALASNAARKGLTIVNTSTNTVSLALGNAAVLNNGITLSPFGVYWMDEFSLSTAAVNAIASAASSNISIQEYQ